MKGLAEAGLLDPTKHNQDIAHMRGFLFSCLAFSLLGLSTAKAVEISGDDTRLIAMSEEEIDLLSSEIKNLEKKKAANQERAEEFREKSKSLKNRNRMRARMLLQRAKHHEKVMQSAERQASELKKQLDERAE